MPKNSLRGEVDIYIGKQTRTLRFATKEIMALEETLGLGVDEILSKWASIRVLVNTIWVGCLHNNKKLTPQKVGRWLDAEDNDLEKRIDLANDVMKALGAAAGYSFDEEEEEAADEKSVNPTGNGTVSTGETSMSPHSQPELAQSSSGA